jgi:hypothetical protein
MLKTFQCFAVFFSAENINAENVSLYAMFAVFFSAENINFFTRDWSGL